MSILKKLKAVRGAVCSENTKESINRNSVFLYKEILRINKIKEKDITAVQFSLTKDLTALNPATALRLNGLALNTALFCTSEAETENSPAAVIRIMLFYYSRRTPVFIYTNGAENLR